MPRSLVGKRLLTEPNSFYSSDDANHGVHLFLFLPVNKNGKIQTDRTTWAKHLENRNWAWCSLERHGEEAVVGVLSKCIKHLVLNNSTSSALTLLGVIVIAKLLAQRPPSFSTKVHRA